GVELAQRLLHEDAADDQVHQLLMRLYVALGRPDQALGQFELAQAASKAAGLELGPEIVALEQAIRRAAAVVPQA
ncbi:MAG TPA: BTAD domain-containing putative transcriptional regulator, partial [Rubrivivax sp.]|nr:BTAD domain-containing putative transcriptional regulator [Rubrivivax sp.]